MGQHKANQQFAQLVEQCAASAEGRQMLAMYTQTVQFTLLDGEDFYIDAHDGQVGIETGRMPERSLDDGYEIKAHSENLDAWFSGRERYSDLIEHGRMFPVASHTTKRHIDYWLAQIVRIGHGQKIPKEVY